jgi:hypothetical protein
MSQPKLSMTGKGSRGDYQVYEITMEMTQLTDTIAFVTIWAGGRRTYEFDSDMTYTEELLTEIISLAKTASP